MAASHLAIQHGMRQTMIEDCKRQAMEGVVSVFSGKAEAREGTRGEALEKLHAKIGQLMVDQDFLTKASGR